MSLTLCALLLFVSVSVAEIRNKAWWNNTVLYQVYPRSLFDSNNDGVGDLPGITSKLSYFVESGIDAIWLSPIYPSPMVDFGYDISDFTDVDPIYGSLQDFKALLARAKELGLKVVLDIVPNHTSDKHVWFQKALQGDKKYKNYYVWANGKNNDNVTPPNNWISVFSDSAWKYVESMNQWYLHQFEYRQPDLNYTNPDVREELINVLKFWLNLGVDGFRIDAASYIFEDSKLRDEPRSYVQGTTPRDHDYLNHIYTFDQPRSYELVGMWRQYVDQYADEHDQDQKLMVIEAFTSLENTIKYYNCDVDPFNFLFIVNVTTNSSALDFKHEIDLWMNSMPVGKVANWVLGNHDNPRVASRFSGRLDQMTMLSMILPGIAVTYYGDEIGMVNKKDISWEDTQDPLACNVGKAAFEKQHLSRDPFRTPFQWDATKNAGFSTAKSTWLPVNQNYKKVNLAKEKASSKSHYKIYTSLIELRRTELALKEGSYRSFTTNNNTVLGIIRNYGSRFVLLLINFGKKQVVDLSGQELPAQLTVKVSSLDSGVKAGKIVDTSKIHLPEKAAVVYVSYERAWKHNYY